MRWALLVISVAGFATMWGVGPPSALYVAFAVMFANFATFCILHDRPRDRAQLRIKEQLRHMPTFSDGAQRLTSAAIRPTAEDRALGIGPMTAANLITGLAGLGFLVWGVGARLL